MLKYDIDKSFPKLGKQSPGNETHDEWKLHAYMHLESWEECSQAVPNLSLGLCWCRFGTNPSDRQPRMVQGREHRADRIEGEGMYHIGVMLG